MSTTARFGLTLMATNTLNKETVFNEGVSILDALTHPKALSATTIAPPATPTLGDVYLIPSGATGDWAGMDQKIAVYTSGWRFVDPIPGLFVWVDDVSDTYRYDQAQAQWVPNTLAITGMSSIPDVDATGLADNMILTYDAATLTWVVQLVATSDLSDVDLTGLTDGQVLAWDAATSKWLPQTTQSLDAAGIEALLDTYYGNTNWRTQKSATQIKADYESNPDTNVFTDAEKTKLAGLEGSKYLGTFASLTALQTAFPAPPAGSYGHVDAGVGSNVEVYIWDSDDAIYVLMGSGGSETAASIKTKYESNPDTNAFTDAEKTKLAGVEAGATADQTDLEIETAYNNQVPQVTTAEKTAGTEVTVRRFAPKDIADMAATFGGSGGSGTSTGTTAQWFDVPVTNGDFETGNLTGWTVNGTAPLVESTGTWGGGSVVPENGSFVATGGANALCEIYQDIALTADDANAVLFEVTGELLKDFNDDDVSTLTASLLDAAGTVLTSASHTVAGGAVIRELASLIVPVHRDQATLRITVTFTRNAGTNNNCGADNIKARKYMPSSVGVAAEELPFARTSKIDNATAWVSRGAVIPANVELVQDDTLGVVGLRAIGSTVGSHPIRYANPAKAPTAGADFDHVFLTDAVVSNDFPWAAGVFVEDSATQNLVAFGLMSNGNFYRWRWTGTTWVSEAVIGNSMSLTAGTWPARYYLRLKRVGGTIEVHVSGDGLGWVKIHDEVLIEHLGDVDTVGIFLNPQDQIASATSAFFIIGHDDNGPQSRAITGEPAPVKIDEIVTAGYTVVEADLKGNMVHKLNFATAQNVIVPPNLNGTQPVTFIQTGAGQVTFAPGAGVTINSADANLKLRVQYSSATLIPDGPNNFILIGDLTI